MIAVIAMSKSGLAARSFSASSACSIPTPTAVFFYAHSRHVIVDQVYTSMPFAIQQGLLVWLFLSRRRSTNTSTRPMDWVFATIGGFLPLAFQVQCGAPTGLAITGTTVQMLGLGFAIIGFW